MELGNGGAAKLQPHNKARWRTPVLKQEQVVEVTNGDSVTFGSDGQTSYGVPLGFNS